MDLPLIEALHFKGKKYDAVILSDYFKTRHKMALANSVSKTESEQHEALVMSFCENLPAESFLDISADDMDVISAHVNEVMEKYAARHGLMEQVSTGKKPGKAPSRSRQKR
jgi:hypothetical protein